MDWLYWSLGVLGFFVAAALVTAFVCYRMAFYVSDKQKKENAARTLPPGQEYLPFHDQMAAWQAEVKTFPCEKVSVTSFDGLVLKGNYYERFPGAVVELMFHGYRGTAQRDLAGGVQRCFACGRNALIVDQRASGESQGNVISFGINEHRDCVAWVEFMRRHFGPDVKIILTGTSMGAATVLMAAGQPMPDNVIGVLADCGYTSPKEIICMVIAQMKLPPKLAYPFVRLGARLFGRFDLEQLSSETALKNCRLPVFFVHGEADGFVPCEMSRRMHAAYAGRKALYTVPGAEHGLAFPVAGQGYLDALKDFFG